MYCNDFPYLIEFQDDCIWNAMALFADKVETPPNRDRVLVSDLRSDTSGEGLETALVATDASRGGVLMVH